MMIVTSTIITIVIISITIHFNSAQFLLLLFLNYF